MNKMYKEITFKLLEEREGYGIYYAIPHYSIKTGSEKTIMFVMRNNNILYSPFGDISQFDKKRSCDDFIENDIKYMRR